ncbi:MAG: bacterioferritin-associated ferredoxin [Parvibaculaceae bacterium]
MMVCHCNVIACSEVRRAVRSLRSDDEHGVVTPGRVFSCCGKRPNCGSCMPLIASLIAETVAEHHAEPQGEARTIVTGLAVAGIVAVEEEEAVPARRGAA